MFRIFFMTFSFASIILAASDVHALSCTPSKDNGGISHGDSSNWEAELQQMDKQIHELKEMKRGYEAKAIRQVNQAQRLQFVQGEQLTAKRLWELAEENKQIADHIQKDIDALEAQKNAILEKQGVKQSSKESE